MTRRQEKASAENCLWPRGLILKCENPTVWKGRVDGKIAAGSSAQVDRKEDHYLEENCGSTIEQIEISKNRSMPHAMVYPQSNAPKTCVSSISNSHHPMLQPCFPIPQPQNSFATKNRLFVSPTPPFS
jgi:hypothetical protein